MPAPTPSSVKQEIDDKIINKTLPLSISNVEHGNILKEIIDLIGANSANLAADLTVQLGATPVGGAVTGDLYHLGDPLESVLRDILIKSIPPTYVPPTALLTETTNNPSGTASFESGTSLNLTFNLAFTKNDAGNEASRKLLKNNSQIATATPYTDSTVTIPDAGLVYKGQVTYLIGAVKNNNLGNPDATGQIAAGTVDSNLLTYNGYRKAFFGPTSSVPANSAAVRALASGLPNPQNGSQFTINIPIGTVKVAFAYPATLEDVASVKYVEFANTDIKGAFTMTTVTVAGNNSYSPISYKVYVFEPVEPFTNSATYVVTI